LSQENSKLVCDWTRKSREWHMLHIIPGDQQAIASRLAGIEYNDGAIARSVLKLEERFWFEEMFEFLA
jgi:hypothetical protein